ncbi:Protein dennd6a [Gaertneriomyces sp. JEL0708]|nr:Protein dennd6a [Gaertneriomyces sp. JEL0708]
MTFIRTDSAPGGLNALDEGGSPTDSLCPPVAAEIMRSRTPPPVSSYPSVLASAESGFYGASIMSAEELFRAEPEESSIERDTVHQSNLDDETASTYSTASEGEVGQHELPSPTREMGSAQRRPPAMPLIAQQSFIIVSSPLSPSQESHAGIDEGLQRLNIRSFWQWALCFCVVNFDLELGQAIEYIYPPIEFSDVEAKNIAFSAFPDSNSTAHIGDNAFTFRMRSGSFTQDLYHKQQPPPFSSTEHLPRVSSLQQGAGLPVDTDGFTYGYVLFRQQRDSSIRRGYFQKSLVILSPHPWPGLFLQIVSMVGSRYMDALVDDRTRTDADLSTHISAAQVLLETASFNIASWPPPPSTLAADVSYCPIVLSLPFLGEVPTFSFPPTPSFAQLFDSMISTRHTDTAVICTPGRFYELFSKSLELLWVCWELVVLGQSILVVAESPKSCNDIVWALVELIKPIPFGGDFRPYFTIQDTDFKSIANRQRPPTTGTILGVTNPVFTKVLEHWPHVIRAATKPSSKMSTDALPSERSPVAGSPMRESSGSTGLVNTTLPRSQTPTPTKSPTSGAPTSHNGLINPFSKTPKPEKTSASFGASRNSLRSGTEDVVVVESLTCKHKPYLSKDRKLIKEVVEAALRGKPTHLLNNMLRGHFMDLTGRFLQPLNRHFETLVVGSHLHMTLSNLRSRPEIRPFKQETFLKSIEQTAPNLPVHCKRPITDLYRAFLMSPNFAAWLQNRTSEVFREWRRRYLEVLAGSDVEKWAKAKLGTTFLSGTNARRGSGDVECVDLLLRLRDEVVKYVPYVADGDNGIPEERKRTLREYESEGASSSISATPTETGRPTHIDLSGKSEAWASSICASAPPPGSPGPVGVMGGVVPSKELYWRLRKQLEVLLRVLPEDLRASVVVKGRS